MSGQARSVAVLGAPSSIGIRPYDDTGEVRKLYLAPQVLRRRGLVRRIGATDLGDTLPPPYRDFVRAPGTVRNESELVEYSRALARRVAAALDHDSFVLLLGGDCSVLLGALLGVREGGRARVGLAYVDAHADFATPQESITGSCASMDLAMAVGRGDSVLSRLDPGAPLVNASDVALLGRRDEGETWYGHDALRESGVLDLPYRDIAARGLAAAADTALSRLTRADLDGFWIHVDADVLDASVLPAVDSPVPGGPTLDELATLVVPLVRHPRALGLQLTIYDPGLDPSFVSADRLVALLERLLASAHDPSPGPMPPEAT